MEPNFILFHALVFLLILESFASALLGNEADCDVTQQRRCRQTLVADLDISSSSVSNNAKQLEARCRRLEDNLNCLVLHVSRCSTPNRSGDLIQRAWKYMEGHCDPFGGWWSYDCFHLEDMKKCEKIFALRDSKTSQASCREYDRFRHCISDVIQKQCDSDDVQSMGNYLLDSAGEMVWTCPPALPGGAPVAREGFVGVQKKKTSIDPFKTGLLAEQESRLSDVTHFKSGQITAAHLRGDDPLKSGPIAVQESHRVYSSVLTGESPFLTGCSARATEETRGCLDRHQYERDQALGARDDEDRLRKECCAMWSYRRCLQNAVRIHCYDTREVDIQSAVDAIPQDKGFLCRNHWIYSCSGAAPRNALSLAAALCASFVTLAIGIYISAK